MLRPKLPNFCSVAHSFQLVFGDSVGAPSGPAPAAPAVLSPKPRPPPPASPREFASLSSGLFLSYPASSMETSESSFISSPLACELSSSRTIPSAASLALSTASVIPFLYWPRTIQRTELASVLKCTLRRSQKWSTIHAIVDVLCCSAADSIMTFRLRHCASRSAFSRRSCVTCDLSLSSSCCRSFALALNRADAMRFCMRLRYLGSFGSKSETSTWSKPPLPISKLSPLCRRPWPFFPLPPFVPLPPPWSSPWSLP